MKKNRKILKIKSMLVLLAVMCLVGTTWSMAANTFDIKLETESTNIAKEQTEVKLYLKLGDYSGDGILGYEGTLNYDKNVFESVSITALNDWETPDYEETTNKFLSTTKKAKIDTNIAEITLKLKSGVTAKTTEVSITNLIISDGTNESTLNPSITYTLLANQTQTNTNTVDTNTTNTTVINSNVVRSNIVIDTNTNIVTNSNITIESVSANQKDQTLASTTIPQTGSGIGIILIFSVMIAVGIIAYIRYRSIPLK